MIRPPPSATRPGSPTTPSRVSVRPMNCRAGLLLGTHKVRHSRATGRPNAAPADHGNQGPPEDRHVETEARMVDIPDVKREPLFPGDSVPPAHLREPGDPRRDLVPSGLLWRVALQVLH